MVRPRLQRHPAATAETARADNLRTAPAAVTPRVAPVARPAPAATAVTAARTPRPRVVTAAAAAWGTGNRGLLRDQSGEHAITIAARRAAEAGCTTRPGLGSRRLLWVRDPARCVGAGQHGWRARALCPGRPRGRSCRRGR